MTDRGSTTARRTGRPAVVERSRARARRAVAGRPTVVTAAFAAGLRCSEARPHPIRARKFRRAPFDACGGRMTNSAGR